MSPDADSSSGALSPAFEPEQKTPPLESESRFGITRSTLGLVVSHVYSASFAVLVIAVVAVGSAASVVLLPVFCLLVLVFHAAIFLASFFIDIDMTLYTFRPYVPVHQAIRS